MKEEEEGVKGAHRPSHHQHTHTHKMVLSARSHVVLFIMAAHLLGIGTTTREEEEAQLRYQIHTHTHRRDKEGSSALLPQTANRLTSLASHTQLQKKEKGFIIIIFHHRKHGRLCGEAGDYFLYATGDYLCTCCLLLNSIITTSCVRFLVFKLLFLFCFLLEFLKKGKKIVF